MLDRKIIFIEFKKLLDILYMSGYINGKIEIDYDLKSNVYKFQVHQRGNQLFFLEKKWRG